MILKRSERREKLLSRIIHLIYVLHTRSGWQSISMPSDLTRADTKNGRLSELSWDSPTQPPFSPSWMKRFLAFQCCREYVALTTMLFSSLMSLRICEKSV